MNRFKRHANARSSTTLSSKPLNRFAMTEMTTTTARCSRENDSCDSLVTGDIALYAVPAGPNLESRNPALPIGLHPGCRCTRTGDTGHVWAAFSPLLTGLGGRTQQALLIRLAGSSQKGLHGHRTRRYLRRRRIRTEMAKTDGY